jgi:hypothetical protein
MRMAFKTATTTAPNAAECQSFLGNLVRDLARVRLRNDPMPADTVLIFGKKQIDVRFHGRCWV